MADPATPTSDCPMSACSWCSADYTQLADRLTEAGWTVYPPGHVAPLEAIIDITEQTHAGKERAYTALSQIDSIARAARWEAR